MKKPILLALLLPTLIAFCGISYAQIYRTTDENGNVIFTDTPPPDGASREEVQLHQTNTTPSVEVRPAEESEGEERPKQARFSVAITTPEDETTIAMGPGNFSVVAATEPALTGGQVLQLYLDGEPQGEAQQSGSWALTNVFRGAHDLTISLIGSNGDTLATSEPVRVYVLRPSVNFR